MKVDRADLSRGDSEMETPQTRGGLGQETTVGRQDNDYDDMVHRVVGPVDEG